jgi:hypothetical protein
MENKILKRGWKQPLFCGANEIEFELLGGYGEVGKSLIKVHRILRNIYPGK